VRAGFWAQSFPEFKAERRGAPISAFLRWDDRPIHRRYRVTECDVLLVVSPAPPSADVLRLVRPGGLVLLNREPRFAHSGPFAIARTPASRIARDRGVLSTEGRPMGNVALLGACIRLVAPEALPALEEAITARMGPAAAELNVAAARAGYDRCTVQHARATDVALEEVWALAPAAPRPHETPLFPVSTADSAAIRTGTWSLERPVLTDACNACAVCVVFCPEGAIARTQGRIAIDEAHCKGCGICEVVCPVRNALAMEEVPV
jgi:2-oxoacid:acceptor oxidoreductase gamma subunit (pyruvate/2-ketoisovalerate family)/2-oxoacid:acceptor oxidoreductase delta subunit (pyruvate/2-ketoisovalerate family)